MIWCCMGEWTEGIGLLIAQEHTEKAVGSEVRRHLLLIHHIQGMTLCTRMIRLFFDQSDCLMRSFPRFDNIPETTLSTIDFVILCIYVPLKYWSTVIIWYSRTVVLFYCTLLRSLFVLAGSSRGLLTERRTMINQSTNHRRIFVTRRHSSWIHQHHHHLHCHHHHTILNKMNVIQ